MKGDASEFVTTVTVTHQDYYSFSRGIPKKTLYFSTGILGWKKHLYLSTIHIHG